MSDYGRVPDPAYIEPPARERLKDVSDAMGRVVPADNGGQWMLGYIASWKRTIDEALQSQQGASADRGEAVAWQFREAGTNDEWSLCLNEKHKTATAASPDWEVRPLYAATPPSPAESAERKCYCPACKEIRSAAPSGVSDADVQRIIERVSRENSIDGMDGDSWDRLLVRAALEAAQPQPGRVEGWQAMTNEARSIQMRHLDKHEGDVYHAMQALCVRFGAKDSGPMTQPTASSQEADHG